MAGQMVRTRQRTTDGWPVLKPGPVDGWFAFVLLVSRIPLVFATIGVAVMLAVTIGFSFLRPRQMLDTLKQAWLAWLFPAMALLSVVWAGYPDVTGRAGIQLVMTALAGFMIGKSPRPITTLVGLFAAYAGYTIVSLLANRHDTVGLTGTALVGVGGEAKNFFAEAATTALLLSITLLWYAIGKGRLLAILGLAISVVACGLALVQANSAGALVAGGTGLAVLIGMLSARRWPSSIKLLTIVSLGILLLLGAAFYQQIIGGVAESFGKDPGLTGRDFLWIHSREQITARPLLGLGYYGFWHPGNPDAVGIGRHFDLTAATSAFSFHNSYIQTLVELGYVGLGVLLLGWISGAIGLLRRFVLTTSIPTCFWFAYFCTEMAKSGVEAIRPSTLIAPTIMLFAAVAHGLTPVETRPRAEWRRKVARGSARLTPMAADI